MQLIRANKKIVLFEEVKIVKLPDFPKLKQVNGKWGLCHKPEDFGWERHKISDRIDPKQYEWVCLELATIYRKKK